MVASAIMFILLGSIYMVMTRGMRIYKLGNTRGKMQGNAIMAMSRLTREIMESNIRSVYSTGYDPYPFMISFLSAVEMDGTELKYSINTGRMEWQKYIAYYLAPSNKPDYIDNVLFRKEYDPTDPATPPHTPYQYDLIRTEPLMPSDLVALCVSQIGIPNERIIAHGIYSLSVEYPIDYIEQRYVTFTFKTQEIALDREHPEKMEYKTRIYFRN